MEKSPASLGAIGSRRHRLSLSPPPSTEVSLDKQSSSDVPQTESARRSTLLPQTRKSHSSHPEMSAHLVEEDRNAELYRLNILKPC
jgi:hypothetical protein